MTAPGWQQARSGASDLGRFEPTPYDLGITDDPEMGNKPVPYSLTPAAQAALERPRPLSSYPGINDPERLAEWCGFASAADMCAAYEAYADDLEARAAYEAEWADNWDSVDSAAYAERAEAGLEPEAEP